MADKRDRDQNLTVCSFALYSPCNFICITVSSKRKKNGSLSLCASCWLSYLAEPSYVKTFVSCSGDWAPKSLERCKAVQSDCRQRVWLSVLNSIWTIAAEFPSGQTTLLFRFCFNWDRVDWQVGKWDSDPEWRALLKLNWAWVDFCYLKSAHSRPHIDLFHCLMHGQVALSLPLFSSLQRQMIHMTRLRFLWELNTQNRPVTVDSVCQFSSEGKLAAEIVTDLSTSR